MIQAHNRHNIDINGRWPGTLRMMCMPRQGRCVRQGPSDSHMVSATSMMCTAVIRVLWTHGRVYNGVGDILAEDSGIMGQRQMCDKHVVGLNRSRSDGSTGQ